jgi:hypothetical protein
MSSIIKNQANARKARNLALPRLHLRLPHLHLAKRASVGTGATVNINTDVIALRHHRRLPHRRLLHRRLQAMTGNIAISAATI